MRSRILLSLLLLLSAALFACSKSQPIRLKFQQGDETTWRFTLDQKVMQSMQGQQMNIGQLTSYDLLQKVDSVDQDGNAYLDIIYKSVRTQMQMPTGGFSFDSDNPPEQLDPYSKMMAGMVDLHVYATVTSQNEVLDVSGADEALDQMMANSGMADGPQAEVMRDNMSVIFGPDVMKYTMQQMRVRLPDQAIAKGDVWTETDTMQTSMELIAQTTYTVTDLNDRQLVLKVESQLQSITDPSVSPEGNMTFSYDVAGTQSGVVKVSLPGGIKQYTDLFQDLKGSMTMQGAAFGTTEPIEVPTQMNTRVQVESLDL